jgi:hypothetical protein
VIAGQKHSTATLAADEVTPLAVVGGLVLWLLMFAFGRCGRPAAASDGARRPTPGGWPRFPEYVVARRYAVSGTAPSGSVQVARPTLDGGESQSDGALSMSFVNCVANCSPIYNKQGY